MVHYKSSYGSYDAAAAESDGLMIIAVNLVEGNTPVTERFSDQSNFEGIRVKKM